MPTLKFQCCQLPLHPEVGHSRRDLAIASLHRVFSLWDQWPPVIFWSSGSIRWSCPSTYVTWGCTFLLSTAVSLHISNTVSFNMVLHMWWLPHNEIILLLLQSCNFDTVRNHNVNTRNVGYLIHKPCDRDIWLSKWLQPTGSKNRCSRRCRVKASQPS